MLPEQSLSYGRTAAAAEHGRRADIEQLDALHRLMQFRSPDTAKHGQRSSQLGLVLAKALGLPRGQRAAVGHALALHDIGKIGIPEAICGKPGTLSSEELTEMRMHTAIGGRILADPLSPIVRLCQVVALSHHERWDGTGYPKGLRGEDIPLASRICAVVDAFDAMTSARPYRPALALAAALAELKRCRGLHFDPRLVDLFIDRIDEVLALREFRWLRGDDAEGSRASLES